MIRQAAFGFALCACACSAVAREGLCPDMTRAEALHLLDKEWVLTDIAANPETRLGDVVFSYGHPREKMILRYDEFREIEPSRREEFIYRFGGERSLWVTCKYINGRKWARISREIGPLTRCFVTRESRSQGADVIDAWCEKRE